MIDKIIKFRKNIIAKYGYDRTLKYAIAADIILVIAFVYAIYTLVF